MTVVAVYDANVLYPSLLRDLLIRIAIAGAVRAHWSDQIVDEVFRNLRANRPDLRLRVVGHTWPSLTSSSGWTHPTFRCSRSGCAPPCEIARMFVGLTSTASGQHSGERRRQLGVVPVLRGI